MRRISRIKRALGCWRCRCLQQDGQDFQDGQDKEGVLLVIPSWHRVFRAAGPEKTLSAAEGTTILLILSILAILLQTHIPQILIQTRHKGVSDDKRPDNTTNYWLRNGSP